VTLMTDTQIRESIASGEIAIEPLADDQLQPASYDLRLGDRAIVTKSLDVEKMRHRVEDVSVPEINVAEEGSLTIPAGAFALVVTKRAHPVISATCWSSRTSELLCSQGAPTSGRTPSRSWVRWYLVLGLANLSPRSVHLAHEEPIATLELHRLSRPAAVPYAGVYAGQQTKATIPRADADYLRTIETLSVSDLTRALLGLSDNVATLSRDVRKFYAPIGIAILVAVIVQILTH
jgi:deoxycytidine triphosphate deaminase